MELEIFFTQTEKFQLVLFLRIPLLILKELSFVQRVERI